MFKLNIKAFSLMESVVTLAILSISAVIIASMTLDVKLNQKNVESKLKITNIESAVQTLLSKVEDCSCQFKGKVFDATNPKSVLKLSQITLSCGPLAPVFVTTSKKYATPKQELVESLIAKEFVSTENSNEYTTNFYITANPADSKIKFQSVPIRLRVYTDPASPNKAKKILGCGPAPLSIPTGLQAVAGNKTCTLTWNESSGAKPISYTVKRSTVSGSASAGTTVCNNIGSLACISNGLTNGVTYYYTVRSSNPYENSKWSAEVSCKPILPPSPPVLAASPSSKSCTISWGPPAGTPPLSYTLYMSATLPVTAASSIVCNTTSNSCTKSGLTDGKPYYFMATAKNAGGTSPYSTTVTCITETVLTSSIYVKGDCKYVSCPSGYYLKGCSLSFNGGDPRGCVSVPLNGGSGFFKEGDDCNAGSLSGTLYCTNVAPNKHVINGLTCPINKPAKYYPQTGSSAGCP